MCLLMACFHRSHTMRLRFQSPLSHERPLRYSFRVLLLNIFVVLCSACSDDPSSAPGGDPLTLLNYTEPTTVGIGGPLIVLFSVRPDAGIHTVALEWRSEGEEWQKQTRSQLPFSCLMDPLRRSGMTHTDLPLLIAC